MSNLLVLRRWLGATFALGLSLVGCRIDISPPVTSGPAASTEASAGSPTPTPKLFFPGEPGKGGSRSGAPASKIPVTWANLNLDGRLIYLAGEVKQIALVVDVQVLDLRTGDVRTIFQTPPGAWISGEAVSPDGKQVVVAYEPPGGSDLGGQETLYIMPVDGSRAPSLLFTPEAPRHRYFQPLWSPDGNTVYLTDVNYDATNAYQIRRVAYPDGALETVIDGGSWPSLSSDGTRLVYVSVDQTTGKNKLFIANADGSEARQVPLTGEPAKGIIDAPIFLRGDQTILFSAPPAQQASGPTLADRLFGITLASAHAAIPSEWWSVPIGGGTPTQLTHVYAYALFAALSPDGQSIASYSSDGIFVMKPDGAALTSIVEAGAGIPGTVSWVP